MDVTICLIKNTAPPLLLYFPPSLPLSFFFYASFLLLSPYSFLYWTDTGHSPSVRRSKLDGSSQQVLVSNSHATIILPGAIAVHPSTGDVYWVETHLHNRKICKINKNGADLICRTNTEDESIAGIFFLGDVLYWTDKHNALLRRVNVNEFRTSSGVVVSRGLGGVSGVTAVNDTQVLSESSYICFCLVLLSFSLSFSPSLSSLSLSLSISLSFLSFFSLPLPSLSLSLPLPSLSLSLSISLSFLSFFFSLPLPSLSLSLLSPFPLPLPHFMCCIIINLLSFIIIR